MEKFDLTRIEKKIYDKLNNFVVIGAFDGESHDNFFERINEKKDKNNSTIIFVEPIKRFYDILVKNVSSIEDIRVICENSAISDKREEVVMVSVKENLLDKYGTHIEGCTCIIENGVPINIFIQRVDKEDLIYVLVTDGLVHKIRRTAPDWNGPRYVAQGWLYGKDCKRDEWRYNEKTWYVPVNFLNRMETLPNG